MLSGAVGGTSRFGSTAGVQAHKFKMSLSSAGKLVLIGEFAGVTCLKRKYISISLNVMQPQTWRTVLSFLGPAHFLQVAVSKEVYALYKEHFQQTTTTICLWAAEQGHLQLLQWAIASGCPWNYEIFEKAAGHGHLEILKWARANGRSWNAETCLAAAQHGHLEILKWARANGCPWDRFTLLSSSSSWSPGDTEVGKSQWLCLGRSNLCSSC
jgi:hypothetical protein